MRIVSSLGLLTVCLVAAACTTGTTASSSVSATSTSGTSSASASASASDGGRAVGMPNPASVNCTNRGGQLRIVTTPAGQHGICVFPSGKQCEEWALMRGECSPG